MSVSFTQVQAAVQNLTPTGGASGPLTLNVLHKTEALLSKLLAFDQSKPVSVEVLKATPNGRAEVIAGGLKLDVKASLPLKAGEFFQLKLEPVGSTVRFVQAPLNGADGAAGGSKTLPGGQNGQLQNNPAQNNQLQNGRSQNNQLQAGQGQISTGGATTAQGGINAKLPAATQPVVQTGGSQGGAVGATGTSAAVTSQQAGQRGAALPGGNLAGGVATNTPAGAGLATGVSPQVTASALIKLVAETIPNGLQTGLQAGTGTGTGTGAGAGIGAGLQGSAAGKLAASGRQGDERRVDLKSPGKGSEGSSGGRLPIGAPEKPTAEQVTAKYTQFSSQVVEEVQEIQGRQAQKADLTIELPLGSDAKPLVVHLQIGRDEAGQQAGEDRDAYALNFSLETEETGPIHASVGLPFAQKDNAAPFRVTLWAERVEFAELLEEQRVLLEDRFAATGLDLSALQIRRGRPLSLQLKTEPHAQKLVHLDSTV